MKTLKKIYRCALCAALVMVALSITAVPSVAGVFDFTKGKVATPGTELHALGHQALEAGIGGIGYFTNGEGRVLQVRATEMANGDLRVFVKQVQIMRGDIAGTGRPSLDAERALKQLEALAGQQPWVGGYAVLPHHEGAEAYQTGVMVEAERRRGDIEAYTDKRAACCRGL